MSGDHIGNLFKQNSIDVQSVDADDSALDVDTATDVAAKFFNDLPLCVSFAKAAHIESEANMAMRLEGAENFTNAALLRGQPGQNPEDGEENDNSTTSVYIRSAIDDLKRTRDREREEWSRTTSTVGGVTMTGGDWAALSQLMRSDEEFRQKILDAFVARGMTNDEAEEHYDRVADVAEIAAIPPTQRTEEQNQTIREANTDPAFADDMRFIESQRSQRSPAAEVTAGSTLGAAFVRASEGGVAQPQAPTQIANAPAVTMTAGLGL